MLCEKGSFQLEMHPMPRQPSRAAPPPADDAAPAPERTVTVSFPVPESLHYALKVRAAQERTTVRGMVMKGLKLAGLDVPAAELVDRRPGRSGRRDQT